MHPASAKQTFSLVWIHSVISTLATALLLSNSNTERTSVHRTIYYSNCKPNIKPRVSYKILNLRCVCDVLEDGREGMVVMVAANNFQKFEINCSKSKQDNATLIPW